MFVSVLYPLKGTIMKVTELSANTPAFGAKLVKNKTVTNLMESMNNEELLAFKSALTNLDKNNQYDVLEIRNSDENDKEKQNNKNFREFVNPQDIIVQEKSAEKGIFTDFWESAKQFVSDFKNAVENTFELRDDLYIVNTKDKRLKLKSTPVSTQSVAQGVISSLDKVADENSKEHKQMYYPPVPSRSLKYAKTNHVNTSEFEKYAELAKQADSNYKLSTTRDKKGNTLYMVTDGNKTIKFNKSHEKTATLIRDENGNVTEYAKNNKKVATYDKDGQLIAQFLYYKSGRSVEKNKDGKLVAAYNNKGEKISEFKTDANGNSVEFDIKTGQKVAKYNSDTSVVTKYDKFGNPIEDGVLVVRDQYGRKKYETRNGITTTYSWGRPDERFQEKYSNGRTEVIVYNDIGGITARHYECGHYHTKEGNIPLYNTHGRKLGEIHQDPQSGLTIEYDIHGCEKRRYYV